MSRTDALSAISVLDTTMARIISATSTIGASQSRISIAVENIAVARENYLAASSRILDADIANESANLIKDRILQQIGGAILSQANQLPNLSLSLLTN